MRIIIATFLSFLAVSAQAACGAAQFSPLRTGAYQPSFPPIPAAPHNALYITDPANQQYAVFDLDYGAQLASLKYDPAGNVLSGSQVNSNATELVWGHHPGAMDQPVLGWGSGEFSYNPNPGGDVNGRGPAILGAACKDGNRLIMYSSIYDFDNNKGLWDRAIGVKNGGIYASDLWSTPYVLTQTVSFVPNPGGSPAYYLKNDFYIANVDSREDLNLGFAFSLYTLGTTGGCNVGCDCFNNDDNQCYAYYANGPGAVNVVANYPAACTTRFGETPQCDVDPPKVVYGKYPTSSLTNGIALSIAAATYLPGSRTGAGGTASFDGFWNDTEGAIGSTYIHIPPNTSSHIVVYILAGDWSAANVFTPQ